MIEPSVPDAQYLYTNLAPLWWMWQPPRPPNNAFVASRAHCCQRGELTRKDRCLIASGTCVLFSISPLLSSLIMTCLHLLLMQIPSYEHVDLLWGRAVDKLVIPEVVQALDRYAEKSLPSFCRKKKNRPPNNLNGIIRGAGKVKIFSCHPCSNITIVTDSYGRQRNG